MQRQRGFATSLFLGLLIAAGPAHSQDTRASLIDKERDQKASSLRPDEVSKTERRFRLVKEQKYLERISAGYNGWRAKLGSMVTGGGFGFGPEYFREDLLRGNLTARASAQISTRLFQKYETQWTLPKLWSGKMEIEGYGAYRNYRSLQYHGTGPDRPKDLRTTYALEDTTVDGIIGVEPWRRIKFGASTGYLLTNVGPSHDRRFVSAEKIFTPAQSPGIDQQTNFLRTRVFSQFDYRDNPLGMAKTGGNYVFQYSWYSDREIQRYSFRRMDIDLQQFIPFFNKTRVIALRAKTTLTDTDRNEQVPFYLQPILGGSDDLRSYRVFRFSDRNSMVMNAEYRWEIFSGLDGAVFFDAGKVFPRRGMLNFANLEKSAGFGLRFNVRNATFMRFDVAFGNEGVQLWIKFNDVFTQRRFGTAVGQPVY